MLLSTAAVTAAFLALAAAVTSLLISAGTARRVNRLANSHFGLASQSLLPNGSTLPGPVAAALAPIPNPGPWLLLIASGGCTACRSLARELNDDHPGIGEIPIVVIDAGTEFEPRFDSLVTMPVRIVLDEAGAFREALRVKGIPHTFVMNGDRIADQAIGDNMAQLLMKVAGQTARS